MDQDKGSGELHTAISVNESFPSCHRANRQNVPAAASGGRKTARNQKEAPTDNERPDVPKCSTKPALDAGRREKKEIPHRKVGTLWRRLSVGPVRMSLVSNCKDFSLSVLAGSLSSQFPINCWLPFHAHKNWLFKSCRLAGNIWWLTDTAVTVHRWTDVTSVFTEKC